MRFDSLRRAGGLHQAHPTVLTTAVFRAKAWAHRARRAMSEVWERPSPLRCGASRPTGDCVGQSLSPLWSDENLSERALQQGKVQNLRVACRALNGLTIPRGAVFSFWRAVGPPWRARGFATGRMLQQGCLIASTGGGLCQLSNALYDAALQAGCTIIERHAHSEIVPGSHAAAGRDATVAWNYIDLRFTPDRDLHLEARLADDTLIVRLYGAAPATAPERPLCLGESAGPSRARRCGDCGKTDCVHFDKGARSMRPIAERQAFIVDECWPEFRTFVSAERTSDAAFLAPMILGPRYPRYHWPAEDFARVRTAPDLALPRSFALRQAGDQGPLRRAADLASAQSIARRLGRRLTPDVTTVTVAQSLLPHLWRDGALGGRRVRVMMTRLPLADLHRGLDAAAAYRPEFASLRDFRAEADLVEAELCALGEADAIVTPHAEIAALFPGRVRLIPWESPTAERVDGPPERFIVFPGPTLARKGAAVVREAARQLNLRVMTLGSDLEGPDFWTGVERLPPGDWRRALAVVQPAWVEDQPRRLLVALAAGAPVIASPACGLTALPGLSLIPPDDAGALVAALQGILVGGPRPTVPA